MIHFIDSRPTVIPVDMTGKSVSRPYGQLIRCESGTDSIVWMREEGVEDALAEVPVPQLRMMPPEAYSGGFLHP